MSSDRGPHDLTSLPEQASLTVDTGQTVTCNEWERRRYQTVTVNGGTFVMENGCELYVSGEGSQALKVFGGGIIRANGNNKIFVDDGVALLADGRGIVTTTQLPRDLQLFAKNRYSASAQILLAQTNASYGAWTEFYGVVYNDNGNVRLERGWDGIGTNYRGALVACGTLTTITTAWGAGLDFRYDETLATVPFPTSENPQAYNIRGWWFPTKK